MTIHELKTWERYFKEIWNGNKTFEIRVNDRDFKKGDILLLKEYNPAFNLYSGRSISVEITYILDDPFFLKEGYVIMSFIIKSREE